MKKTNIQTILLLATFLSIMFLVTSINAALLTPANSATIGGTTLLNASNGTLVNLKTCTFYAKSANTANSSWTLLTTISNTTNNPSTLGTTFNSNVLEDGKEYYVNSTCINATTGLDSTSTATITVDNTVPTAASSLLPATDTDGDVDFSVVVVGRETTACTLYFDVVHPGTTNYAMTHSGNTCTVTINNMPELTYMWHVDATDGTNTTSCTSASLSVDVQSGGGGPSGGGPITTAPTTTTVSQTQLPAVTASSIGGKFTEVINNVGTFFKTIFTSFTNLFKK